MSDYDHSCALKEVAQADCGHVNSMLNKLDDYAISGGKAGLGNFLTALVVGDLVEAVSHADETNIKYLRQYVQYIYCRVPSAYVSLGRPVLRVIRKLMGSESQPISQKMVEEAMGDFESRLRCLKNEAVTVTELAEGWSNGKAPVSNAGGRRESASGFEFLTCRHERKS